MAHVQVEILLPVQLQYLLHFRQRHPFGRRLAPPPVIQTANPKFLIALPPAPHLPVADADDFCRLPPGDLPGDGSQNHFLYFHGPLHGGLAVRDHVLHALLPLPPAKRTLHVLIQPDISCANDMTHFFTWRFVKAGLTLAIFTRTSVFSPRIFGNSGSSGAVAFLRGG